MSFIYVGQQNEQSLYSKLIKIQCVVEDCESDSFNCQLISVPAIINFDQQGDQKLIVYLCKEHLHKPQIYENKLRTQITFCQRDLIKWLKLVSDRYPYEILLENAKLKLDAQSCCMRENIKYYNLEQILTILELISNHNDIISNLVNRELVKKVLIYQFLFVFPISSTQKENRNQFKSQQIKYTLKFSFNSPKECYLFSEQHY